MSRIYLVFLVLALSASALALFEGCDEVYNLNAYGSLNLVSPGYPQYGYVPGSSCRYQITAPLDFQVSATCYIQIPAPGGECTSEFFYIALDGNTNLYTADFFCSSGNIQKSSDTNQMVIAYVSQSDNLSGVFNCNFTATPKTCECGWGTSTRIVGGTDAVQNEFPAMAGLVYSNKIFCGSTIISPRYVVSAAHCFFIYPNINDLSIFVGDVVYSKFPISPAALYSIKQTFINPNYNRATYTNDIALVLTTTRMTWSRSVGPACLPFLYTIATFANTVVEGTGWGTTSFGGPLSTTLQKVGLNVLSNGVCSSNYYSTLVNSQMCTYTPGKDECQADSGGPLWYIGNRRFCVAVVSYGGGCATDQAAVNTRMTSFLTWIESITGPLCRRSIM